MLPELISIVRGYLLIYDTDFLVSQLHSAVYPDDERVDAAHGGFEWTVSKKEVKERALPVLLDVGVLACCSVKSVSVLDVCCRSFLATGYRYLLAHLDDWRRSLLQEMNLLNDPVVQQREEARLWVRQNRSKAELKFLHPGCGGAGHLKETRLLPGAQLGVFICFDCYAQFERATK